VPDGAGRFASACRCPAKDGVDDQRVLYVHEDADRGIDTRQRLDGEHE
jgi:hypothetical protein